MNVVEIDAASNNGVENIRDIREQVQDVYKRQGKCGRRYSTSSIRGTAKYI